jgi:hypothetical protein
MAFNLRCTPRGGIIMTTSPSIYHSPASHGGYRDQNFLKGESPWHPHRLH